MKTGIDWYKIGLRYTKVVDVYVLSMLLLHIDQVPGVGLSSILVDNGKALDEKLTDFKSQLVKLTSEFII
ncbi:hypothetical protein MTR_7g038820 [Medicago truncatula]|uniref:Uncharacterized protein n=1 Tax=Medicago truncatula TaxID=3880 RepID=A0A072TXX9_MEDTR|nr:hypothetical protein MTR_7g038820 [Medicago truncatula]